jgi:hypothetical protein
MEITEREKLEIEILQLHHKNEQLQNEKLEEELKALRQPRRWWKSINGNVVLSLLLGVATLYVQHGLTQIRIDAMQRSAAETIQRAEERTKEADARVVSANQTVHEASEATAKARVEYESILRMNQRARAENSLVERERHEANERLQAALQQIRDAESKLASNVKAAHILPCAPVVATGGFIRIVRPGCVN